MFISYTCSQGRHLHCHRQGCDCSCHTQPKADPDPDPREFLAGIRIVKFEHLPPGTIYASPDVYDSIVAVVKGKQ